MFFHTVFDCIAAFSENSRIKLLIFIAAISLVCAAQSVQGAVLERTVEVDDGVLINIQNPDGRVTVSATADMHDAVAIKAESSEFISDGDVSTSKSGHILHVIARPAHANARIDLILRVPQRSRVHVKTVTGAVDVLGDVAEATVQTDTGTIRADVPLDALSFAFDWRASRPRFFSELTLPKIEEKAGGRFQISGHIGKRNAGREDRVRLSFTTERGVVLFGVDPSIVPADLRERPLTEAARGIIDSGDQGLIEAINRVAPHFVAKYVEKLPPPEADAPVLHAMPVVSEKPDSSDTRLARVNASVTDRFGRAISGLKTRDFDLYENGQARSIVDVQSTQAPFNLVLLLDVSGSVEERLDFIRKSAISFVNTVSPVDRVAIISFRDDVQVISDFTTDHKDLLDRVNDIEAGGATSLYDALAYTLVHTLKPLRGERTAVVLLSDGDDNRSFIPFPSVLEAATESGALIYPLYIPSGLVPARAARDPVSTADPMRARYLELSSRAEEEGNKLASASGGIYYSVRRLDDLQKAYDDVVNQLRTAYTITYQSTAGEQSDNGPGKDRQVRVRVNREGASVRLSPPVGVT